MILESIQTEHTRFQQVSDPSTTNKECYFQAQLIQVNNKK